ncbi:MAG TPA: hypothetical protein VKC60_03405 [Opitutaceae bacterium]|nr:hypothetical protein [Opitutaceae bacterium]
MVQRFELGKPHWWQWPTVLSLDAPAVALAWQWLFARTAGVTLSWAHFLALGAAVWLVYAADRWIEGWSLTPGKIRTQRHHFYQRWRWPVFTLWVIVLLATTTICLRFLSRREILGGMALAVPVLAYLLSHQWLHRGHPWRVPKEICVAVIFALGTSLFPLTTSGIHMPIAPIVLFGWVCFTNCTLIATWEREVDVIHGQTSLALQFNVTERFSRWLPWTVAASAILIAFESSPLPRSALLCVGLSSLMLGMVNQLESRIGRELARVLADAVLLTPLLVLVQQVA